MVTSNPAVTIGMLATKRIKPLDAVGYIVGQLAGATIAALLLREFFPNALDEAVKLGATLGKLSDNAHAVQVLVIEAVLTFFLITTIFAVAVDQRGPKNVYGFAIGLTVAFDILAAGPITGAILRPSSGGWLLGHPLGLLGRSDRRGDHRGVNLQRAVHPRRARRRAATNARR